MVARKPIPGNPPTNANSGSVHLNMHDMRRQLWTRTDSEPSEAAWEQHDDYDDESVYSQPTEGGSAGQTPRDVPAPLRAGAPLNHAAEPNPWEEIQVKADDSVAPGQETKLEHVPSVLRPGGRHETNPFKRKPVGSPAEAQSAFEVPPPPTSAPPPPPPTISPLPPTEAFSGLQVADDDSSTNPWKPAMEDQKPNLAPPQLPPVDTQEPLGNIWESRPASGQHSRAANSPVLVSLPAEGGSAAWGDGQLPKPALQNNGPKSPEEQEFSHDAHAWDDVATVGKGKAPALPAKVTGDGWNLIDHEPVPEPGSPDSANTWENFSDAEGEEVEAKGKEKAKVPAPVPPAEAPRIDERAPEKEVVSTHRQAMPGEERANEPAESEPLIAVTEAQPPPLPSRSNVALPPTQPPRPTADGAKSETYQVKNVNWFDATARQNPRKSPILVQNANGPCPLVALVNCLSLTTPAEMTNTVLVETLRSREQISLNLLLEAVFDELMSPRRTHADAALPDVTELYDFLKGLHTGMNVNPRFIPTAELATAHRLSVGGDLIPGTFENTRDMKLYATFSVPLIHGWLPPKENPVYGAFDRQASSYDDVQSLLFREEELEDKLSSGTSTGLNEQEQQLYQDIMTIKSFLSASATQLTPWGLEVITKATQPGTFSILFRNDHFSTLYRHPQTRALVSLVTDAGYHTHDEIVWESLVDVNGEHAEFLSGDFRLVGGPQQPERQNSIPGAWYEEPPALNSTSQGEWQTVTNRRGNNNNNSGGSHSEAVPPASPNTEQEDRDLALALQLQEEEEERHRNEQAARLRETQLSEQFIEQQGRDNTTRTGPPSLRANASSGPAASTNSLVPARRSSNTPNSVNIPVRTPNHSGTQATGVRPATQQQQVRPLVPPPANTTSRREEDDAPPSYEQASKATPYVPPAGHPSHPHSSLDGPSTSSSSPTPGSSRAHARRRSSGLMQPVAGPGGMPMGPGRPRPGGQPVPLSAGAVPLNQRDKDCIIM